MPTRLIYEHLPTKPCENPDHRHPPIETLTPGFWVHECPACGWVTSIHVPHPEDLK